MPLLPLEPRVPCHVVHQFTVSPFSDAATIRTQSQDYCGWEVPCMEYEIERQVLRYWPASHRRLRTQFLRDYPRAVKWATWAHEEYVSPLLPWSVQDLLRLAWLLAMRCPCHALVDEHLTFRAYWGTTLITLLDRGPEGLEAEVALLCLETPLLLRGQ